MSEGAEAAAAPAPAGAEAGSPPAPAVAAAAGNEGSVESVTAEVTRLKAILDASSSAAEAVVEALEALGKFGGLPTKVLSDTMIGKTVNQLAKAAPDEAVRAKAKSLVEDWRQLHRKRKSSSNLLEAGIPPLKRANSSVDTTPPLTRTNSSVDDTPKDDSAKADGNSQTSLRLDRTDSQASQKLNRTESQASQKLNRMDSTMSIASVGETNSTDAGAEGGLGKMEPYREKVLQKFIEALGKLEEVETKGEDKLDDKQRDPVVLAGEIEEALAAAMPKKEVYMSQARSVLYNLRDSKNPTFRFKLMVGFYKPEDVPSLTSEDMASDEKNSERAAQRKYAMEEIQTDWALKHGQQRITGMFTCGKCKGVRTTYFQMQTRSSDEPMTTFVTCLTCNNRWKFC